MIYKIFTYKSSEWEYEKEWRLVHLEKNIQFEYPPEILRSVNLGMNCTDSNEQKIKLILSSSPKFKNVKLFKMEIGKNKYELNRIQLKVKSSR